MESVATKSSAHQQPLNSLGSQLNDVTNQHPPTAPSPILQGISKVVNVVKSLVDIQRQGDKKPQANRLHEIDSYISKILGKLKGERRSENEPEEKISSRKSVTPTDTQENPIKSQDKNSRATNVETDNSSRASQETAIEAGSAKAKSVLNNIGFSRTPDRLLSDVVIISRQKVDFGVTIPGKVLHEPFEIMNKSNEDIVVQILSECFNTEFQDLDEYVYSIRHRNSHDYNDKHSLVMAPRSMASLKIALKVPDMKLENSKILGEIKVLVKGVKGLQKIALETNVTVPRVICPKELYNKDYKASVIKLAIKLSNKPETKFPLKNLSDLPVALDFRFYTPKNVEENPLYDCVVVPGSVAIPAQGSVMLGLGLKNWKALVKNASQQEVRSFKRVLIGLARNSAVVYSFLLIIEVY